MSIVWNTGPAAMRARHNLRLKLKNNKKKAPSLKLQATSALKGPQLNNIYEESAEDI